MEHENTLAVNDAGIRSVAAGRGVEWLVWGFKTVFKTPGFWIVGGLILAIAFFIANFIPLIGNLLATALYVIGTGAAMRACVAIEAGRDPVAEAQQVLTHQPLLILGAIAGGLSLLITMVVTAMVAASVGTAMLVSTAAGVGMALISGLLMGLVFIALFMALWLAPALVLFKNMQPFDAMKMSMKATLKNLVPYIVLAILTWIAFIVGSIPLMLGLLIVFPASMCASYIAYKEMFD